MERRTYLVADLFCGAGGSSTGAVRAAKAMDVDIDLVAVNHWDVAIATHSRNHPLARHHCVNLDAARPEELVPGGRLDLLMASPECVFFSRARGGRPVSDQRRMSAWHVQRWATALDVRCILVENVPEFRDWGPLLTSGRPDPGRKGWYFGAWVEALRGMGYAVDWRLLNAANYGDTTTRTRFFLQARKDGLPIAWPAPSHTADGGSDLFGRTLRWRAAAEVIDWTRPGPSLLGRTRPLSLKTRLRIARGLARFGGPLAPLYIRLLDLPADDGDAGPGPGPAPFLMANRAHNAPKPAGVPLPTFTTAAGGGVYLVQPSAEPFVLGQQSGSAPRATEQPLPTVAGAGAISLIEPLLTSYYGGTDTAQSVDRPLPTVTTKARFGLCSPLLVKYRGTSTVASVDEPLPTLTAGGNHLGLCEPMAVPYGPKAEARPVDRPLPTILTKDRLGVVTPTAELLPRPFLVPQFGEAAGQAPRLHDVDAPLPAVTGHGAGALVAPMVLQMAQVGRDDGGMARDAAGPLPTITTHKNLALAAPTVAPAGGDPDPRRLVLIDGRSYLLDIRFRMLSNRELARAMGFDDDDGQYQFAGNVGEVTKQIGNAVAVNTATALVGAILGDGAAGKEEIGK